MASPKNEHTRLESTDESATQAPVKKVDTRGTQGTQETPEYPTGIKLVSVFAAILLALLCVALDRTIIATAIPKITDEFNSLDDIGWYGSAYLLTSACFQLPFGKLYAEFSIKWVFLVALIIFEVGSVICAAAPNSPALIVGRAIAGLGSAGVATGCLTILAHSLPVHKRPKYTGALGAGMGIAQVTGPTIGGALADHVTWRWCFWINLPIAGVAIPVVAFLLNLPSQNKLFKRFTLRELLDKFDFLGTALIMPATICLLLALQWGGSMYAWSSWRVVLLLVLFAVCFVAWAGLQVWEGDRATVPMRILRIRSMVSAMLYMFCIMGMLFPLTYYIPVWFQAVGNVSAQQSGIDMLATTAVNAVFALCAGFITTAIGYYVPLLLAGSIFSSIATGLITRFSVGTSTAYWASCLAILGLGVGLGGQQSLMVPQTVLKGRDLALGTSAMMFVQTMSGTILLSVAQNVFQSRLLAELAVHAPDVDPAIVVGSGASDVQANIGKIYPPADVQNVILSYALALQKVFLMCTVLACLSILGSATLEWKSVKKPKKTATTVADKAEPPSEQPAADAAVEVSNGKEENNGTELRDLPAAATSSLAETEVAVEAEAGAAMPEEKKERNTA